MTSTKNTKRQRVFCILQLCITFSAICWNLGYPFLGELYEIKTQLQLYDTILNGNHLSKEGLLEAQKNHLQLKKRLQRPIGEKFYDAITSLKDLWGLAILWTFLGVIIPIYALLERSGINQAVWLLPITAVAYSIDNSFYGLPSPEIALFPSEKFLIENYLGRDLSEGILEQREDLLSAWKLYLVDKWSEPFQGTEEAVLAGEQNFTLARLRAMNAKSGHKEAQGIFFLSAIILWSLLFAYKLSQSGSAHKEVDTNTAKVT